MILYVPLDNLISGMMLPISNHFVLCPLDSCTCYYSYRPLKISSIVYCLVLLMYLDKFRCIIWVAPYILPLTYKYRSEQNHRQCSSILLLSCSQGDGTSLLVEATHQRRRETRLCFFARIGHVTEDCELVEFNHHH